MFISVFKRITVGLIFIGIILGIASCSQVTDIPIAKNSSEDPFADMKVWMSNYPDYLPLAALSIPGTHDSGALYDPPVLPDVAKTQDHTISEQLRFGVRYLDIRNRHINNEFYIYHGPISQKQTFQSVLDTLYNFLDLYPTETVIVAIKNEGRDSSTTRPFVETFNEYIKSDLDRWYLKEKLPTLGEARGKLVLLRRFSVQNSQRPLGIHLHSPLYTIWPENTRATVTTDYDQIVIQDKYNDPGITEKKESVEKMIVDAKNSDLDTMYINFTSAVDKNTFGIPVISAYSNELNKWFMRYANDFPRGKIGIIAMDYITSALSKKIIEHNEQLLEVTPRSVASGYYYIRNFGSGKFVDFDPHENNKIIETFLSEDPSQLWEVINLGGNYIVLRNKDNGQLIAPSPYIGGKLVTLEESNLLNVYDYGGNFIWQFHTYGYGGMNANDGVLVHKKNKSMMRANPDDFNRNSANIMLEELPSGSLDLESMGDKSGYKFEFIAEDDIGERFVPKPAARINFYKDDSGGQDPIEIVELGIGDEFALDERLEAQYIEIIPYDQNLYYDFFTTPEMLPLSIAPNTPKESWVRIFIKYSQNSLDRDYTYRASSIPSFPKTSEPPTNYQRPDVRVNPTIFNNRFPKFAAIRILDKPVVYDPVATLKFYKTQYDAEPLKVVDIEEGGEFMLDTSLDATFLQINTYKPNQYFEVYSYKQYRDISWMVVYLHSSRQAQNPDQYDYPAGINYPFTTQSMLNYTRPYFGQSYTILAHVYNNGFDRFATVKSISKNAAGF